MFDYNAEQRANCPAISSLPGEILDQIISELDYRKDLFAFALASKSCANAVIPHHTQYRVIRVQDPLPSVWAHLARRSDLARNIRELHITDYHDPLRYCYPTTLVDVLDRRENHSEESNRIRNICRAFSHMHRLRIFSWSWTVAHQLRPTSHPLHENAIMTAVRQLPSLEALSLNGRFALHALSAVQDPRGLTYPLWRVANLRCLRLRGYPWANIGISKHLCVLLSNSPDLEYLEIPLEFRHLAECRLPKLKKLKLVMESGANPEIDQSRVVFLENHPSIEELYWFPMGIPRMPNTLLPNLKSLVTNDQFIVAMNHNGSGTLSNLLTPPATPSATDSLSTCHSDDMDICIPESPILRQIESLCIATVLPETLLELDFLDRASLRKLRLDLHGEISTLHEVAEAFPNIEWLALQISTSISTSAHQWFDILPRFKKLRTFRGYGAWPHSMMVDMRLLTPHLTETCPNLRECTFSMGALKLSPRPTYPFDATDGMWD